MKSLLQTRRVFVAVLALGLFAMAARGVTDPDVWWHLRTGQLMVHNHSIFHTDPYSFTKFGQPWIDHAWLSEILMYSVYRVAGFGGLIVVFAGVIAAAFLFVFSRCPGRPYLAGLMTIWGAFASAHTWGARPQMLSLLLASVSLLLLKASEQHPSLLWWTAPLMLLWVNLHAGYTLGLAFLALFLLGEALEAACRASQWQQSTARLRKLSLMFLVCLAIVAVNPNGLRIYAYPFETLRSVTMHRFIQEWSSPNFHDSTYLPLLLMLLALLAGLTLAPARLRPRDLVLLLVTIPAALRSSRHIPILVLVLTPVLARLAEGSLRNREANGLLEREQSLPTRRAVLVNAVVLAAVASFAAGRVRHLAGMQQELEARHFPMAAAAFLAQQRPPGPILNHYNWGGYFIWKLYPDYRVAIDGRADVYGDQLMEDFGDCYYLTDNWQKPLQQWGIRTLILPPDAPVVTALRINPEWKQIFVDSQAVVLTRGR
jgi:hypothetical protein